MSETNFAKAREVYATLCSSLDNRGWKYTKLEDDLRIRCAANGDDLPMELIITVEAKRELVYLISRIPVEVPEDKRLDAAIAVSFINNLLVDGSFDYDVTTGSLFFRMTNSYKDTTVGEEVFNYMLVCSFTTIDEYNDKLLMLAKGMMTIEQFIASENN